MGVALKKTAVDVGIVTNNPEEMLNFYRDLLGFRFEGTLETPGRVMYRLWCGDSLIKILHHEEGLDEVAAPGGIKGATGYRYWTISVSNLDEITQECADAGYSIPVPATEIRPGVRISMVEDPDGNWVEFIER